MAAFEDLLLSERSNRTAAEFVRRKIRGIVEDRHVADALCPEHLIGCKRLCVDSDYFATFNRPNVKLVDLSTEPMEEVDATGVRTKDHHYALDVVVLATGFDAMTGALRAIDVRGRGGRTLADAWADGPRAYLGLAMAGFPNLFTITGPGSPSVLTNMVPSIEQHAEWITDCIDYMRREGHARIEADETAQNEWVALVTSLADFTLFPRCNSWYVGANVPGKPRVFMPFLGFPPYVERCNAVADNGYEGFVLSSGRAP